MLYRNILLICLLILTWLSSFSFHSFFFFTSHNFWHNVAQILGLYIYILDVIKRNPLFFHSISCKNIGFLFITPNIYMYPQHLINILSCININSWILELLMFVRFIFSVTVLIYLCVKLWFCFKIPCLLYYRYN